jgi:hypothetical protein
LPHPVKPDSKPLEKTVAAQPIPAVNRAMGVAKPKAKRKENLFLGIAELLPFLVVISISPA